MRFLFVIAMLATGAVFPSVHADEANLPSLIPERLTLRDALMRLSAGNREIRAARRAVDGFQADTLSAAQSPNPVLSLNSASIALDRSAPGRGWDKQVDTIVRLDQVIERGDKRELRVKAAEQAVKAGQADIADTIRQQRQALTTSYYDLLLAQQKEEIQRQVSQLYARTLEATIIRLKAGDISPNDLARLQVEAARADNDLRQAQAEREKCRLALAYLLGLERQADKIHAADGWPDLRVALPRLEEEWLGRRADVRAAQARVDLADAKRAQARALRTRDVSVGIQYEHFPPESRNTMGVGISLPLFANYHYEGEIRRAESDYDDARENLERVSAQALTDISKTRADLEAAAERVSRYHGEILEKALKNAAAAEFAYRHGAQGLMDLLDARRTLRAVQIDAAVAQSDHAKALAAWDAAISVNGEDY